ncbi:hypothetical protein Q7P37_002288 [Cladosporium fusiforme]
MATNNEPTLEGIPNELLDRVIDNLADESILSLRLTSKYFDAATFDRFIKAYVADQRCWIYDEERWTRLINMHIHLPRLCGKVRTVILAESLLEESSVDELAAVPTQEEHDIELEIRDPIQIDLAKGGTRYCIYQNELSRVAHTPPSTETMCQMLRELSSHSCSIHLHFVVVFDYVDPWMQPQRCVPRRVLNAINQSNAKIASLITTPCYPIAAGITSSGFEAALETSFSMLEKVSVEVCSWERMFLGESYEDVLLGIDLAAHGCRAARNLRELSLNLSSKLPGNDFAPGAHETKTLNRTLYANQFSNIRSLILQDGELGPPGLLLDAINTVKPTLVSLTLRRFSLGHNNTGMGPSHAPWIQVWEFISTISSLRTLRLHRLEQLTFCTNGSDNFRRLDLTAPDDDSWDTRTSIPSRRDWRDAPDLTLSGREEVINGLEWLIKREAVMASQSWDIEDLIDREYN